MLEAITQTNSAGIGTGIIETWQWKKIIERMYDDDDYKQLEQQIYYRMSLQQDPNTT